ncbi:MAG TPA: preprotein translocase subunit YajC [Acidothermaceae bacterium]
MGIALPLLLFVLVYVVVILPQGRRRKQAAALQRAVEPGSKVILTSGLHATVVEIDDDAIVVEAAPGVQLRYAKAAVLRVVPEPIDDEYDDDHDDAHDDHELEGSGDTSHTGTADHDGDTVARPSNREDPSAGDDATGTSGNDAGSGPVPTS